MGDLFTKVKMLYAAEVASEMRILELAREQVQSSKQQLIVLLAKLGKALPAELAAMQGSCTDKLAALEDAIVKANADAQQYALTVSALTASIRDLASELGLPAKTSEDLRGSSSYPELSEPRIRHLESVQAELGELKNERVREVRELCSKCIQVYNELALLSEGFSSLPDHSRFHDTDLAVVAYMEADAAQPCSLEAQGPALLRERLAGLIAEKEKRRAELTSLGEDIARQWTLLRVPSADKQAFLDSFSMTLSSATLGRGQQELRRLKALRLKNQAAVIVNVRHDIEALWEDCAVAVDQRASEFPLFFAPESALDEEAVDAHARYFATLKDKAEDLRPLLVKIQAREAVVGDRIELEQIQLNPDRLKNRGASAFADRKREEAMTKGVRGLERLNSELAGMLEAWASKYGPFEYGGVLYVDRIAQQEAEYLDIREILRSSRRERKDVKEPTTMTPIVRKLQPSGSGIGTTPRSMNRGVAATAFSTAQLAAHTHSSQAHAASAVKKRINFSDASSASHESNENAVNHVAAIEAVAVVETRIDMHVLAEENDERAEEERHCERDSVGSADSEYTSMTEQRERKSSCTVVRAPTKTYF